MPTSDFSRFISKWKWKKCAVVRLIDVAVGCTFDWFRMRRWLIDCDWFNRRGRSASRNQRQQLDLVGPPHLPRCGMRKRRAEATVAFQSTALQSAQIQKRKCKILFEKKEKKKKTLNSVFSCATLCADVNIWLTFELWSFRSGSAATARIKGRTEWAASPTPVRKWACGSRRGRKTAAVWLTQHNSASTRWTRSPPLRNLSIRRKHPSIRARLPRAAPPRPPRCESSPIRISRPSPFTIRRRAKKRQSSTSGTTRRKWRNWPKKRMNFWLLTSSSAVWNTAADRWTDWASRTHDATPDLGWWPVRQFHATSTQILLPPPANPPSPPSPPAPIPRSSFKTVIPIRR